MTVNRQRPYNYMVAEGRMEDVTAFRRFGHNGNVPATYETVWCNSSLYVYMTTASRLLITSSSAEDGTYTSEDWWKGYKMYLTGVSASCETSEDRDFRRRELLGAI